MKSKINSTPTTTSSATPDPTAWETLWFSDRPVPRRHTRLRTGEPVDLDLYKAVVSGIRYAVRTLEPGRPYKADYFVDDYEDFHNGDRRRAGRCLADIARRPDSPIGLIVRGRNQPHRYYVIPPAPPASSDHGVLRDGHQQPQL